MKDNDFQVLRLLQVNPGINQRDMVSTSPETGYEQSSTFENIPSNLNMLQALEPCNPKGGAVSAPNAPNDPDDPNDPNKFPSRNPDFRIGPAFRRKSGFLDGI